MIEVVWLCVIILILENPAKVHLRHIIVPSIILMFQISILLFIIIIRVIILLLDCGVEYQMLMEKGHI